MRYENVEKENSEKRAREKAYELWCKCDSVAEFKIKLATMMPEISVFPFLAHYFRKMHPVAYVMLHIIVCCALFFTTGPALAVLSPLRFFHTFAIAAAVSMLAEWIWEVKVSSTMRELAQYEFDH